MKLYIAGKITGDENYRAKFRAEADRLEALGHVVLNSAILPDGLAEADYMRLCFAMLDCADAAAFLPDWEESAGAAVERAYCKRAGKPVCEIVAL